MKRRPCGTNDDSMSRGIHKGTTEKLETSNECTRRSLEKDEESI